MVEKTDRPKKASERGQAGKTAKPAAKRATKKSARKAGKTAARKREAQKPESQTPEAQTPEAQKPESQTPESQTPESQTLESQTPETQTPETPTPETKKPAAKKGRKRGTKAAVENLIVPKEELAARRIAGANPEVTELGAPENQHPNGSHAPGAGTGAGTGGGTAAAPESVPSEPAFGKRGKYEPRTRAGENADGSPRPNTLVPTNGIHTTERRLKRKLHQNRGVMALIAATLLGIIILGEQTPPPNLTEFEREIAASQAVDTYDGSRSANPPPGIIQPKLRHESVSIPGPEASRVSERQDKNLNGGELVEMERLLARLDLGPSTADGIVDNQTEAAIRLYQEIAGLAVDGAPSRSLLADIREVVKILEDGG